MGTAAGPQRDAIVRAPATGVFTRNGQVLAPNRSVSWGIDGMSHNSRSASNCYLDIVRQIWLVEMWMPEVYTNDKCGGSYHQIADQCSCCIFNMLSANNTSCSSVKN